MPENALDAVRVTADRVRRFSAAVEEDPSPEIRQLWRAALVDLREAIREARSRGCASRAIQEAAGSQVTGRFVRLAADEPTRTPNAVS